MQICDGAATSIAKQTGKNFTVYWCGSYIDIKAVNRVISTVEDSCKWRIRIVTNRQPALTAVIKHTAFHKIGIRELDVSYKFEVRIRIVPYTVQLYCGCDAVWIILRAASNIERSLIIDYKGICTTQCRIQIVIALGKFPSL